MTSAVHQQGHCLTRPRRYVPKRTSTSTVPPAAKALEELAAKAVGPADADAVAYDLYEQIRREVSQVSGVEEARRELYAYQALVRALRCFAKDRVGPDDDTARRVYATISRFNLGAMFRPGGSSDRFLIPHELTRGVQP